MVGKDVMQFTADSLGEFGGADNSSARLGDVGRAISAIEHAIDRRLDPLGFDLQADYQLTDSLHLEMTLGYTHTELALVRADMEKIGRLQ